MQGREPSHWEDRNPARSLSAPESTGGMCGAAAEGQDVGGSPRCSIDVASWCPPIFHIGHVGPGSATSSRLPESRRSVCTWGFCHRWRTRQPTSIFTLYEELGRPGLTPRHPRLPAAHREPRWTLRWGVGWGGQRCGG